MALSVAAPPQAWHGALAAWTRRHGHARDDERLRRIAATIVTHRGVRSGESRECVVRGAMGPPRGAAPRASMGRPRARQRRANGTVRRRAPARRAEAARSRAPPPSGASQQYTPHRAVVEALPGEVTACLHRRRVAQTRAATLLGLSVCLGVRGPAAKAVADGSPATRSTLAALGGEEAAQPSRVASHRSGLLAACCGPCGTRRPRVEPGGGHGGAAKAAAAAILRRVAPDEWVICQVRGRE